MSSEEGLSNASEKSNAQESASEKHSRAFSKRHSKKEREIKGIVKNVKIMVADYRFGNGDPKTTHLSCELAELIARPGLAREFSALGTSSCSKAFYDTVLASLIIPDTPPLQSNLLKLLNSHIYAQIFGSENTNAERASMSRITRDVAPEHADIMKAIRNQALELCESDARKIKQLRKLIAQATLLVQSKTTLFEFFNIPEDSKHQLDTTVVMALGHSDEIDAVSEMYKFFALNQLLLVSKTNRKYKDKNPAREGILTVAEPVDQTVAGHVEALVSLLEQLHLHVYGPIETYKKLKEHAAADIRLAEDGSFVTKTDLRAWANALIPEKEHQLKNSRSPALCRLLHHLGAAHNIGVRGVERLPLTIKSMPVKTGPVRKTHENLDMLLRQLEEIETRYKADLDILKAKKRTLLEEKQRQSKRVRVAAPESQSEDQ